MSARPRGMTDTLTGQSVRDAYNGAIQRQAASWWSLRHAQFERLAPRRRPCSLLETRKRYPTPDSSGVSDYGAARSFTVFYDRFCISASSASMVCIGTSKKSKTR
jgi:hypothetical protein